MVYGYKQANKLFEVMALFTTSYSVINLVIGYIVCHIVSLYAIM